MSRRLKKRVVSRLSHLVSNKQTHVALRSQKVSSRNNNSDLQTYYQAQSPKAQKTRSKYKKPNQFKPRPLQTTHAGHTEPGLCSVKV